MLPYRQVGRGLIAGVQESLEHEAFVSEIWDKTSHPITVTFGMTIISPLGNYFRNIRVMMFSLSPKGDHVCKRDKDLTQEAPSCFALPPQWLRSAAWSPWASDMLLADVWSLMKLLIWPASKALVEGSLKHQCFVSTEEHEDYFSFPQKACPCQSFSSCGPDLKEFVKHYFRLVFQFI